MPGSSGVFSIGYEPFHVATIHVRADVLINAINPGSQVPLNEKEALKETRLKNGAAAQFTPGG